MSRVHDLAPARAIGRALDLIPSHVLDLVGCEFWVGIDPGLAGIHDYDSHGYSGCSYKDTAHTVYDYHQEHMASADRTIKVFLPSNESYQWDDDYGLYTVVHELGHVLDYRTDFDLEAEPVTDYAHCDQLEANAEAFVAWVQGKPVDDKTKAFFDNL